ncbi:MAG: AbrB/MazE/SpoVT family DNA-binding domain-containing protein [Promethearchaeota archaeon]|nr:MAG: AbrB/MazE/SpoVT family DNA-binding domain-containing protein [Candidatus Lokiarchaeota archaeon]
MIEKGVVGSKGELFPPKKLRKKAGFKPGDEIIFEAADGIIIAKKKISILEALALPKYVQINPEEWEKESREENKKQGEKFDNEL